MQENDWIGLRERDNFAYVIGQKPIYPKDCKNSLIISDLNKGKVEGISNSALIRKNGKEYLIPINNIEEILRISKNVIGFQGISYQKPLAIIEREVLKKLDEDFIRRKILETYGFLIESANKIQTNKGNYRVYEISSPKNGRFMLKYHGTCFDLFEAQTSLLGKTSLFPKIIKTKNSKSHMAFENSIYYLEEFVNGNSFPKDIDSYYNFVGKYLALIHNEFRKKTSSIIGIENCLNQEGNPLSESNLISMKIDLDQDFENYFSIRGIKSFFENLNKFKDTLPSQIIHGDLNKSNLIWKENNPTAIDFETINFSKRINEFVPALLFEGNLSIPRYSPGSLDKLLVSYNIYSDKILTEAEKTILPDFLKFTLIKSHVIYVIRKNLSNEIFKNQIKDSLNILGGEKNVH